MRDLTSSASIGPADDHKRKPNGVCNHCGIYVPPELREAHLAALKNPDPFGPEFIEMMAARWERDVMKWLLEAELADNIWLGEPE